MKPTPLGQVLADDLLLDRVGARLDTDDELGSLLLSLAHHVDAPVSRPSVRARRRRNHRALTVLAALGIAVSGATVAAAIESAPDAPATAGGSAHTRFLPQALQALGLPFAGPGLAQGRLLLPPSGADALAPAVRPDLHRAAGVAPARHPRLGCGPRRVARRRRRAAAGQPTSGSSASSASSAALGASRRRVRGPRPWVHRGEHHLPPVAEADDGEQEASGAPQNGATKTPAAKSQNGGSTPESSGPTHTPTSSPTTASTGGNAFAGTGNAGQGTSHAATPATPATPGSSGSPASPATPARRSATTPPGEGGGDPQGTNGAAKGKVVDPSTPTVPAPAATTAASAAPAGP